MVMTDRDSQAPGLSAGERPRSSAWIARAWERWRDRLVWAAVVYSVIAAVGHLRERGVDDLAQITLMSDGATVYECTSADEVVDLVQGGQGVFGIAVGRVWREVEGSLAELPGERPSEAAATGPEGEDELSVRRRARRTG